MIRHAPTAFALAASVLTLLPVGTSAQTHKTAPRPGPKPVVVEPTGPTVYFDTTLGRITCRLYDKQAPRTTENFLQVVTGAKDWTDPSTATLVHGQPFYNGTTLWGVTDGIAGGDRLGMGKGAAGAPFPQEKSGLGYERAGRLVMSRYTPVPGDPAPAAPLTSGSLFSILEHADEEAAAKGGTVFGQCDDASLAVVTAISHNLLATENHPEKPIGVDAVSVQPEGQPLLAIAARASSYTPTPAPNLPSPFPAPQPTGPTAQIETTLGTLTCQLYDKETPIGTANFIGLAEGTRKWSSPANHAEHLNRRFYDGLHFARVIPDFMVQNSDLPTDPTGDGDIGYHFDNEVVPGLTFDRPGRLAYANAGPNTNQSEFFVTEHPVHRLDGRFTIFGQCDDASVKLVEQIARVPRDKNNKPLTPVTIRRVTITR